MFIEQMETNTSQVSVWVLSPYPPGSPRCIGEMMHNGSKYARVRYCGMPHRGSA
jgi:hypothetical protein